MNEHQFQSVPRRCDWQDAVEQVGTMRQAFLCYAGINRPKAKRLRAALHSPPEFHVWFDKKDLLPGMRWEPAIRKAIRESRYFIALLSKRASSGRGYRNSELRRGLEVMEEFPEDRIFVIPTRLDDCEPPIEALTEFHYADLFPNWEEGVQELRRAMNLRPPAAKTKRPSSSTRKRATKRKVRVKRAARPKPSDYHYRIGLADLDAGIPKLNSLAHDFNRIQQFFFFSASKLSPSRKALKMREELPQLDLDQLSDAFYRKIGPLKMDHVLCITRRFLAFEMDGYECFNYLGASSPDDDRVMFTSIGELEEHADAAGVPLEVAIAYVLVAQLACFFLDVDYHETIRACPLDFTENHADMVKGLQKGRFCGQCAQRLGKNPDLKRAVSEMLKWGRS